MTGFSIPIGTGTTKCSGSKGSDATWQAAYGSAKAAQASRDAVNKFSLIIMPSNMDSPHSKLLNLAQDKSEATAELRREPSRTAGRNCQRQRRSAPATGQAN